MALFGKIQSALTGDVGTFLTQGTNGLDRKRRIATENAERDRIGSVRQQLEQALQAAYSSQQQVPHQMGPTVDEGIPQSPGPQQVDQAELIRQALLMANAQGLNTGDAQQLVPQDAYQIINGGNGSYGIANKRSGQVQAGQLPNPMLDDNQAKLQAQIEQYKALAEKARQDAALSAAKAKGGGFAPRAPARGRASAKSLPPLPSGKMPIIVSQ